MAGSSQLDLIKQLRTLTKAGMMDCKRALQEAGGSMARALEILKKKGIAIAAKKQERTAQQGIVEAYIHTGSKTGVLVEVNCETDFVARNEEFKKFVKDIAMQIAATNPLYIKKEDVPADVLDKGVVLQEVCLLEQPFIKDEKQTVNDYLIATIAKVGENIIINRFTKYQLGEK